jgi:acetyl-CoA carboxylase biotin carboxylase subunit
MISRILIANRGEIALRIVRACRDLGLHSVVAYSQADHDALATQLADEAICIGPAASSDSYLRIDRIIAAAEVCDVDAIHPGYGFLAENAHFAEVCKECNITFIGPSPDAMRRMGDKAEARKTMQAAGVPVTPGSKDVVKDVDTALKIAHEIGFPVMIKASAGGGGKGMRAVHNDASLVKSYHAAKNEAEMAFGNGDVYIEKLIVNPRHVEIQIMADTHGNVIHLGERDCSLQRRHQKLVEESPSPAITPELREKMGEAAVRAAQAVNYANAGTVEFLLGDDGEFYFMEMNTRIQVEHPVTEMVTGIDLITEQLRVAAGEKLSITQDQVRVQGHAIEIRVNAENPARNFAPCPGEITLYCPPGGPGIRVDSHVYTGYRIPPYYDSMVAKLIVHGRDREEALARASRALREYVVEGVHTTIEFAEFILNREDVIRGDYHTGYLEHVLETSWFEPNE